LGFLTTLLALSAAMSDAQLQGGVVIGPISQDDWDVMLMLVHTISRLKEDRQKYRNVLKMDEEWLRELKEKYRR
jgi:hypothetical protein